MSTHNGTEKKGMGLSLKIISIAVTTLFVVVALNYMIFMSGYRTDAEASLMAKAAAFTAVADEAKNHASAAFQAGSLDLEALGAELEAEMQRSGDYSKTRFYNAIPVVTGWTAADNAATREGLNFEVPAFNARNKDNEPAPGSFRAELLRDLENQVKGGGEESLGRIDPETNTLHYMRAIKLDASCMICHGDPKVYDKDGDGIDPVGFRMESWAIGDMHGAFEIQMPLGPTDEQVAGFFKQGMMVTVPVFALAIGGFIFALRVLLTKPLNAVAGMMKDVASGDGDLTKRMNVNRTDEIGVLTRYFDQFLDNLHGIISDIAGNTRQVAAAATEIAASSEEMATGLSEQQRQTEQAGSAITELTQSVGEVARQSNEAARAAEESRKNAIHGGEVVVKTVQEISAIASQIEESARAVSQLGRKGEEIGGIIAVINDIADQTNLLALNAAIEAARAGEHGRGFAVVADEVRKLAERTTQATEEVSRSIREIQQETTVAVERIDTGSKRMSGGVDLAKTAGNALEQIVSSSQQLLLQVQNIAAASEEQTSAAEQIARSVDQINSVTRESTEGANQAAQAAADLSLQSEQMQQLVGRFKL